MNYKCEVCGQTALTQEQEQRLIQECKNKLPSAALDGKKDQVLGIILENYPIGKVTVYNKIFKLHNIVIRKPKKERKVKYHIIRSTDEEVAKIVNSYEKDGKSPSQMVAERMLGTRTPQIVTIYGILRRNSKIYQTWNITDDKAALRDAIFDDHVNGLSTQELSIKYDKSSKTITDYIGEAGLDISQGTSEQEKLAIYYFYFNYSNVGAAKATAQKYDKGVTTIHRIVEEMIIKFNLAKRDNSNSYRLYELDQYCFSKIDIETKAYIIGIIATDGNVSNNVIGIELQRSDRILLEIISKCIGSDKPLMNTIHYNKYYNKYYEGVKVAFISKQLTSDLGKLGIIPNKSLSLDIDISKIPSNLHRHFWRGCIDGDGWVYNSGKVQLGLCGSKLLMNKFCQYLKEILDINETITQHHSIWCVVLDSPDIAKRALHHFYEDSKIYLPRKNIFLGETNVIKNIV